MFKRKPRLITVSDNLGNVAAFDPRCVNTINCGQVRPISGRDDWYVTVTLHDGAMVLNFYGYKTEREVRRIVTGITEVVNECRSRK